MINSKILLLTASSVTDLIVHFLSQVSEINKIYYLKETDNSGIVWSVLTSRPKDVRKKVYAKERALIDFFKEDRFFDFRLSDLDSAEPERSGALLIYFR